MPWKGPYAPVFNPGKRRGHIKVGTQIGEPPPEPPTVTINQGATQSDPADGPTVRFDVAFSEAVAGFTTGDVTLSGTAGATTGGVINTGDDIHYTVVVSGMTASGTVIASIAAGVATSIASGLPNEASTSTDNTVHFPFLSVVGSVTDALLDRVECIIIDDDHCYLTASAVDRLVVVDVSAPASPSVVGSRTSSNSLDIARGLAKSGSYVFVACGADQLVSSNDVSTPSAPALGSTVVDVTNLPNLVDIAISGSVAVVTAGIPSADDKVVTIDITNPLSMSVLGFVQDSRFNAANKIVADGDFAYVVSESIADTFSIVDISTPASPSIVGSVTDGTQLNGPTALVKDGDVVYVLCAGRLTSVDVSIPASPAILDSIAYPQAATGIYKIGSYVFIARPTVNAIAVVNASDPSNMVAVSSFTDATNLAGVQELTTDGTYIYAAVFSADRLTVLEYG